jgi:hypothetical protein
MTISTFVDLKSQIATYLNRSNLTAQIPILVQLAETRIYYGNKEAPFVSEPLRIQAMEQSYDVAISAQTAALPSDYLAHRRLYLTSDGGRLDFMMPTAFWDRYNYGASGQPKKFTIEAGNLVFGPIPDTTYTGKLLYYRKFSALAADSDTNWILANAPGVYIQGALIEAYRFVRNMEQAQAALNAFTGIVNALNGADKSDVYAAPWAATPDCSTP